MTNIKNITLAIAADAALTWSDGKNTYSVPVAAIPADSLIGLAQRGFTHELGNVVASKVTTFAKKVDKTGVAMHDATELAVMAHDWRNEKVRDVLNGDLGTRSGGPRLPREERLTLEVAREMIVAAFHRQNRAKDMPKASDKAKWQSLVETALGNAKFAETVKAEVGKRMETPEVSEDDLDDILAGVA